MVLKTEEVIYRNAKIDLLQDPIPQSSEFLLFLEIIFFSYLQSSLLVCNFGKPWFTLTSSSSSSISSRPQMLFENLQSKIKIKILNEISTFSDQRIFKSITAFLLQKSIYHIQMKNIQKAFLTLLLKSSYIFNVSKSRITMMKIRVLFFKLNDPNLISLCKS